MALDLNSLIKNTVLPLVNDLLPTTAYLVAPGAITTSFDPETNTEAVRAADTVTAIDITPPSNYSDTQIDGTNVLRTDMKTIVDSSLIPSVFDFQTYKLRYNSVDYEIVPPLVKIAVGNDIPAYELQLRI